MKKIILSAGILLLTLNANAQKLSDILGEVEKATGIKTSGSNSSSSNSNVDLSGLSSGEISTALKQALNIGVEEGIDQLSAEDGYFKNEMVKILMPEELRKVENVLRSFGLSKLADEGVKLFNRAAEDAVTEAAPIFADAITSMTFDDAKSILLSGENAATAYLEDKTSVQLFNAFEPKVQASLGKVGADKVWNKLITNYNMFTGQTVTTDLNQYVTEEALDGVFKMVADKESGIRNNAVFRTTSVLQDVFGALD
ncbi:DUF4197 domain-containing protein [Moheibacter lacus]|uniref:DUF4197 domain-containing protein n=1 Tax=Moheibacter lacus TaxID=2745851 RepID=A0A838ZSF2_9FLAO|nr:DUF4197 domain-containing protein [Moheibacter lacus]MBA5629679.1 DUF4197 domain-containing protein [Moheibacter lacus]